MFPIDDPYPAYRAMRAHAPVQWRDDLFGGAWVVSGYDDAAAVLNDTRLSARRAGGWVALAGDGTPALRAFKRMFSRTLLFLEGRMHRRVRASLHPPFKPAALRAIAPCVRARAEALLDALGERTAFDFMQAFARPLPALVMCDLLGIAQPDQAAFRRWSDDIADFIGGYALAPALAEKAAASAVELAAYFSDLIAQRRARPGGDLVSDLIAARDGGQFVSDNELLAQCCMLLFAGYETTRNLLGNGLHALLRHPEAYREVGSDPGRQRLAVRELLRYDSPVQYTARRALAPLTVAGVAIEAGQLVIALLGAANHDPAVFTQPERLDLARNEAMHLSFGSGPHVCIGAALTTIEASVAFEVLARRLPGLRLAEAAPQRARNTVYRGFASLPVRYDAR